MGLTRIKDAISKTVTKVTNKIDQAHKNTAKNVKKAKKKVENTTKKKKNILEKARETKVGKGVSEVGKWYDKNQKSVDGIMENLQGDPDQFHSTGGIRSAESLKNELDSPIVDYSANKNYMDEAKKIDKKYPKYG